MESIFKRTEDEIYPRKILANQLITVEDLQQFKKHLVEELLVALRSQPLQDPKKWMKSHEVRRLLKISPGTLQTLKSSGVIPTQRSEVFIFSITRIFRTSCSLEKMITRSK
jgi:hypothetical protein